MVKSATGNNTLCFLTLTGPPMHDMIKPLSWILGKWRGEGGIGKYPTIKDFKYDEEIEFTHVGQPNIQFT